VSGEAIRHADPQDAMDRVIVAAFAEDGEQVARLWAEGAGHEDWMTGRGIYRDAWWRHDSAGLRDPLLAQLERGTR
jgi:hypothetical protein